MNKSRCREARPTWSAASRELIGLLLALTASACSVAGLGEPPEPQSGRPPVLNGGEPSAEALAWRALAEIARGNKEALRSLRISKNEFCDYVWHELPSSKIPNVNCDWVWDQATMKSEAGLSEMWQVHGGKKYGFVSLRFAGGSTPHRTFTVHNDPRVVIRDEANAEFEVRLFGSMLEMSGRFKLFSLVVD